MGEAAQKILPHGNLESPVGGVWLVRGMCPFPMYRYMTIWLLPDSSLLVHSAIAMDEARMAKLDALGKVSVVVVPHTGHRLDVGFYKKRYPQARVVAPAAARPKVEEVVAVDGTAEDELPKHGITVHPQPGWKHGELGYEFALLGGGRAVVLSDIVTTSEPPPGVGAWLMDKLTVGVRGPLGVPRITKRMLLADREAARPALARLADIADLRIVSVAHGRPVLADCSAAIRQAAAGL